MAILRTLDQPPLTLAGSRAGRISQLRATGSDLSRRPLIRSA